VNPKFRTSVYDGLEFNEHPYDSNKKFSIFIPKRKDSVMDMLARHEESQRSKTERHLQYSIDRQKEREKVAASKPRYLNVGGSPSKTQTTVSPTKGAEAFTYSEIKEFGQADRGAELDSPESKLKTKLFKDVEMARSMDI